MGKRVRDLFAPEYKQAREIVYELSRLRQAAGVTQAEVDVKSHYSQSGISQWESFKMPNYAVVTLIRIAKAIGYKVNIEFVKEDQ